jgi:DNA-binding protein HU-beta
MNKSDLIDKLASDAGITKVQAKAAVDSYHEAVAHTLKTGGRVELAGFGSFSVSERTARSGRNPRTGETIKIKAAKVARFKPGKALKDSVN